MQRFFHTFEKYYIDATALREIFCIALKQINHYAGVSQRLAQWRAIAL
jgi:hypothetical protein